MAFAAEADNYDEYSGADYVVTATKTQIEKKEVPTAVQVVTQEDIQQMGAYNLHFIKTKKFKTITIDVDFYRERIKDIILGTRKQALLSGLERDLLENARAQGAFVIK
mgnify:CR=1 FL=1